MESFSKVSLFYIGLRTRFRTIFRSRVFLDYAAGLPEGTGFWKLISLLMRLRVLCAWYANPESIHADGVRAKQAVEKARIQVARFLGVGGSHVFFTRGGTESCSAYIQGVVSRWRKDNPGRTPIVITSSLEHSAVYETLRMLSERKEVEVVMLPTHPSGITNTSEFEKLLAPNVVLVSCMLVNNELGTIQPVRDIGRMVKAHKKNHPSSYPLLHIDAIQAAPYIDCAPSHYYADAVSLGGSKLGVGPSVGVLASLNPSLVDPIVLGGRQEKGLFPGSLQVKQIVKLGLVLETLSWKREWVASNLEEKREYMKDLLREVPGISIFDTKNSQAPHILTVWISGISGEEAVIRLDAKGISCSPQAACSDPARDSRIVREVMKAREMKDADVVGQVRFSFGLETTRRDIRTAVKALKTLV